MIPISVCQFGKSSATVLSYGLQPLALTALRRQVPDYERPYRLQAAAIIAPLAFIIANLIIYWSGWSAVWPIMLAVVVGFAIVGVTYLLMSPDQRPSHDWKSFWWLLPYLGGLALISFLGATDFGGRGLFSFGWDALVVAVFSVVIFVLAVYLRLPNDLAERYILETSAQGEAEEEVPA